MSRINGSDCHSDTCKRRHGSSHSRLTQQNLNLRIGPVIGRDALHKAKKLVELHALELTAELTQEGRTNVNVEVFESTIAFADVGVPQPHDTPEIEFTEKQTIHPLEGKLHKLDAHLSEVGSEVGVDPVH